MAETMSSESKVGEAKIAARTVPVLGDTHAMLGTTNGYIITASTIDADCVV
jgi:hypothetical protein